MTMRVASLASGSSGNSYYIECAEGAVIVDAGLSGKELVNNLALAGGDPGRVRGVIVTHDHHDHVSGAGVLQRRHGWKLWMTKGTRAASRTLGRVEVETIRAGSGLNAAGMRFEFLPSPHDGAEPIMVTVERTGSRCGVFTDLGHPSAALAEALDGLDFVFLESNYDPDLLAANPRYPAPLKARIKGRGGHISNAEAVELVVGLRGSRLKQVVLSHLSEENNNPSLAYSGFVDGMGCRIAELKMRVGVAFRRKPMLLCAIA